MNYKIDSCAYYLPERIIDNEFLSRSAGIDMDFLENKVGIRKRHIAGQEETTSDMAVKAALNLFNGRKINREIIDLVIVCTQNPDYRLPTTACIVQERLKLKKSCISFDINLGCSGFVYSMAVAGNFIKTGMAEKALLIMADQYSKIIDYSDKNTASLFGDAASAIVIGPCPNTEGVLDASYGTDGSSYDKLIAYNSGVKIDPEKSGYIFMDGREIFKFSIQVVPASVKTMLRKHNLKISDIKYFIFHQANKYILTEIQKRLEINDNQMIIDLEDYGNTISSTIPIAYKNILDKGMISNGDILIFCGFGVGLSWGTILYQFNK
jgi:3-oxoacyl-[acyl-carrier-protein] synthase-3